MKILNMDCVKALQEMTEKPKLIFADPPDNIGLSYDGYNDTLSPKEYFSWLMEIIIHSTKKTEIFWLSYNAIYDFEITTMIYKWRDHFPAWKVKKILWRYTFSQYNDSDFAIGYRPMYALFSPEAIVYPGQILIPSRRTQIGDNRAMGPRLPDNVWEFPRVVGNSWERRTWHPTQHPQDLLSRIIRYCCYVPSWTRVIENQKYTWQTYKMIDNEPSMQHFQGKEKGTDLVVDLFAGSGSSGHVCGKLCLPWIGIEQSKKYCVNMEKDFTRYLDQ